MQIIARAPGGKVVSACRKRRTSAVVARAPTLRASPRPRGARTRRTPPCLAAIDAVSSVLPLSTTTMSSKFAERQLREQAAKAGALVQGRNDHADRGFRRRGMQALRQSVTCRRPSRLSPSQRDEDVRQVVTDGLRAPAGQGQARTRRRVCRRSRASHPASGCRCHSPSDTLRSPPTRRKRIRRSCSYSDRKTLRTRGSRKLREMMCSRTSHLPVGAALDHAAAFEAGHDTQGPGAVDHHRIDGLRRRRYVDRGGDAGGGGLLVVLDADLWRRIFAAQGVPRRQHRGANQRRMRECAPAASDSCSAGTCRRLVAVSMAKSFVRHGRSPDSAPNHTRRRSRECRPRASPRDPVPA